MGFECQRNSWLDTIIFNNVFNILVYSLWKTGYWLLYIYIFFFQIYLLDDFYNDSDCQLFLYFFHCPVIVTHASTMLLIFKLVFKASKGFCPYWHACWFYSFDNESSTSHAVPAWTQPSMRILHNYSQGTLNTKSLYSLDICFHSEWS